MTQERSRTITSTAGVGRVGVGQTQSSSDVVLSKMVNDRATNVFAAGNPGFYASDSLLDITAERQSSNLDDYENILKTQPELELPIQILISSILSPKSANKITLKHGLKKNGLPPQLAQSLLSSAKACVDDVYNIKAELTGKLRRALFTHGADITIIMGEAAIDDVINGRLKGISMANESLRVSTIQDAIVQATKPRGFFGTGSADKTAPKPKMAMEDILGRASSHNQLDKHEPMDIGKFAEIKGFVAPEFCDNPAVLGLGMALEDLLEDKRNALSKLSEGGSIDQIDRLYHDIQGGIQQMVIFPRPDEASRKSKTRPVRKPVPPEAVSVVYHPGNPKKHLGILVLIDEFGAFASRETRRDYWRNISDMVGGNKEVVSSILERAAKSTSVDNMSDTMIALSANASFREMAIQDTERRLSNGSIGNARIAQEDAFFDLMFERGLAGRQTRVLYVPADLVSYWAYRYNPNGTGRSMLEDNKFLAGIRSMLTVANTETALRNSIDYTKLNVTLDQNDPNKSKTKETIIDQYVRNRLRSTPWNTTNPRRIVEMMAMAGVSIGIEGGDNYPGTKVDITREDIQQREINMDLDDSIFRRLMMGFGLAPEIVDLSMQIEFSSKIITSNELSLKRVMVIQDVTNYLMRQDIIKTFLSDPIQMDAFEEIVKEYVAKMEGTDEQKASVNIRQLVLVFLGAYEVNLPRPENGLDADIAEFTSYMDAVDKALDAAFNDDALGEIDGNQLAAETKRAKSIIRQYRAVKWMIDHDFMMEVLEDLKGGDDKGLADVITATISHYRELNGTIKALIPRLNAQNITDSEQFEQIMSNLDQFRDKTTSAGGGGGGGMEDDNDNSLEDSEAGTGGDDLLGTLDDDGTGRPAEAPAGPEEPAEPEETGDKPGGPEEEPET